MDKVKGHRGFGAEYGYGDRSLGGGSGNDVFGYGFGNIPGAGTLSGDGSEKHIDVHYG